MFEIVQYIREIEPSLELAWTRWIIETEGDYNDMFLIEALNEGVPVRCRKMFISERWRDMVSCN